jgi:hypothetical protein
MSTGAPSVLGSRKGTNQYTKELPPNFEEVRGKETAEVAAKKAGFGKQILSDGRRLPRHQTSTYP